MNLMVYTTCCFTPEETEFGTMMLGLALAAGLVTVFGCYLRRRRVRRLCDPRREFCYRSLRKSE